MTGCSSLNTTLALSEMLWSLLAAPGMSDQERLADPMSPCQSCIGVFKVLVQFKWPLMPVSKEMTGPEGLGFYLVILS